MVSLYNRKFIPLIIVVAMTLLIAGCSSKETNEDAKISANLEHPRVQIEMEDGNKMVLELYPEFAPETVENFVNLAHSGFYDGLKFHRIMKGFMVQGGDPIGNGTGGSGKNIRGEFSKNGFSQNTLNHTKGIISMARSKDPNSASSQFFIMDGEGTFLDGEYAAFGKLIEGEETLDKIVETPVAPNPYSGEVSVPTVDVIIKGITVLGDDK